MRHLRQRVNRSPSYKWWAAAAIGLATVLEVSYVGAVNIAQPTIAERFNSDLPTVQWVTLGHMLAISALLLPMGRLSDMVGRKRVFVWGMLVFSLGSVVAGSAPSLTVLILLRVLHGAGPAMLLANQMTIMTSLFPDSERGRALGLNMFTVGLGLVAGPALGGLMLAVLGWRFVFFIYLPLGAVCLVPALVVLDEARLRRGAAGSPRGTFDWLGAVLSTLALLVFLLAVTGGHRLGWGSPSILAGLAAAAGFLSAFVWWELRTASPMLDLTLFKAMPFSVGIGARSAFFLAWASPIFLIPFYLQGVAGYGVGQAGLIMTVMALATVVTGPLGGRLTDRFGWRPIAVGGAFFSAMGLLLLTRLASGTPLAMIIVLLGLQSGAHSLFVVPINSVVLGSVDRDRHSVVVAFLQLLRNAFTVVGIAVATVVVTATMESRGLEPSLSIVSEATGARAALAFASGMRTAFLAMAGLQLAVAVLVAATGRWVVGPSLSGAAGPGGTRSPSK